MARLECVSRRLDFMATATPTVAEAFVFLLVCRRCNSVCTCISESSLERLGFSLHHAVMKFYQMITLIILFLLLASGGFALSPGEEQPDRRFMAVLIAFEAVGSGLYRRFLLQAGNRDPL